MARPPGRPLPDSHKENIRRAVQDNWNKRKAAMTNNDVAQPAVGQKYVYTFHLWPDETWGRRDLDDNHPKIPHAVFDLFRMINHGIEMELTALEFVRFRHDVESFGITLREISRRPYHEEETIL
jgi:hypothetical protein